MKGGTEMGQARRRAEREAGTLGAHPATLKVKRRGANYQGSWRPGFGAGPESLIDNFGLVG
jgi:hypothetical protein